MKLQTDLIRVGIPHTCVSESLVERSSYRDGFCIGNVAIAFSGCRNDDVFLSPSLEPFRSLPQNCDICVRVEWETTLSRTVGRQLFDSGSTWRLYENEAGYQFDFHVPSLGSKPYKRLLVDGHFNRATLQMSEESLALMTHRLTPMDYPFDELLIMHRLTQEKAIELHGCGMVSANGVGNLFIGHSGAGKSTTTRLWTASQDVEILSDDRIIVRLDQGKSVVETPVRSIGDAGSAGVLRLRDCSASRNSRFAQDDKIMRMYGTPWHGEAMFASPNSAPLTRILVLEHGYANALTRLSPSQAVAELFARSFVPMHRHEYVESALAFLEQLAESVPCYRYSFEPDQRAVDTILNLHD